MTIYFTKILTVIKKKKKFVHLQLLSTGQTDNCPMQIYINIYAYLRADILIQSTLTSVVGTVERLLNCLVFFYVRNWPAGAGSVLSEVWERQVVPRSSGRAPKRALFSWCKPLLQHFPLNWELHYIDREAKWLLNTSFKSFHRCFTQNHAKSKSVAGERFCSMKMACDCFQTVSMRLF